MTRAESDRFAELLGRIGAELDRLLRTPRVDPIRTRDRWLATLSGDVPADGIGADAALEQLASLIPDGARICDAGFLGFITGAPSTVPMVAYAAGMIASPQRYTLTAFNRMEELSLEWLGALCGLGPHMRGVYSSGGSTANFVALGAARQWAFEQIGVDVARDGFAGRTGAVYTSSEAHHTILRSAAALGIGRHHVRAVPVDDRQRMDVDALARAIERDLADDVLPVCVAATAGTTNTGAIDPLRRAGELAREHGIWFHVDGAYGLPGILDERVAPRFDGLELADSAIVDPHKWLNAPVGIAATFVRDRDILARAFTQEPAAYLAGSFADEAEVSVSIDHMGISYDDLGIELSAPARGVAVWALIVEQGERGIRERIRRDNDRARRVTELARRHPSLEALTEPELSIACIRHRAPGIDDPNAFNQALLRRLVRETELMPSATVVNGCFAIRPCFINSRTRDDQVDALVESVAAIGDEMLGAARC